MFARIAFDLPIPTEFTYAVPETLASTLQPGQRVRVPFRTTSRIGWCVALEESTEVQKVREISAVVDETPLLPEDLMQLASWIASYYVCSLGDVLQAMLPGGVRRRAPRVRRVVRTGTGQLERRAPAAQALLQALETFESPPTIAQLLRTAGVSRAALSTLERAGLACIEQMEQDDRLDAPAPAALEQPPRPEPAQAEVLAAVAPDLIAPSFRVHLVLGVTGSGKTEVYLRAIAECIRRGRQAIVLVPEIALTPQTVRRFRARFARVAVLHSAQTHKTRRREWKRIRRGEADVVVGPRSAVFAPVPALGLIVVDEEHENSFKQDQTPRYQARDVAVVRAQSAGCPVLLGSATPSLESYSNARAGRYTLHHLPRRVRGIPMPPVELVDMRGEKGRIFSTRLRLSVSEVLTDGGQVILFLNRRGFATVSVCRRCGHTLGCPHCSSMLVFHKRRRRTVCHLCGHECAVARKCSECFSEAIEFIGWGTERVAEEAAGAWPGARLQRIDSDSVRGPQLEAALDSFRHGETRILVGTQMLAKGHDFPNVRLVGIVNADTALHLPDFRANERTFQLVVQVSGRAGRSDRGGRVLVQTYNPDHYTLQAAATGDYEDFARRELEERELLGLPPARRAALMIVSAEQDDDAREAARAVHAAVAQEAQRLGVELRGPARAPIERVRGRWRWMLLALGERAGVLPALGRRAQKTRLSRKVDLVVDVDPAAVL
ncbi:MAG: primosomal protein N' [Planctomycetota bacterium]